MSKLITVTIEDIETGQFEHRQWQVDGPDSDGKLRTEIGIWLGEFIGKYKYQVSSWINRPKPKQ